MMPIRTSLDISFLPRPRLSPPDERWYRFFQPSPKIRITQSGSDESEEKHEEGNDAEDGEGRLGCRVTISGSGIVDSDQLVEKVGLRTECQKSS